VTETMRADALRIGTSAAVPGHVHGTEDVVADHGLLLAPSLLDDDHPQYVLTNGARTLTGDLKMGSKKVTGMANASADTDAVAYGQVKNAAVGAGNGLTGGGAVAAGTTLHVGSGWQVTALADYVDIASYSRQITDWNDAKENGWYMAPSALNSPTAGGGWWYGFTIAHNAGWCCQIAFPFANSYPANVMMVRTLQNSTWGSWFRLQNYVQSWDTLDNFIFLRHGGDWSGGGAVRWAIGNKKDAGTGAASANDQFRIQRYDTAGTYAGNLMTGTPAGVVNFPGGHTLLMDAMATKESVEADRAATVGIVDAMIRQALSNAGVTPQMRSGESMTGINLSAPTPDFDPSDNVEPHDGPTPPIDPNTLGTPQ
jgi:hypothetical protein